MSNAAERQNRQGILIQKGMLNSMDAKLAEIRKLNSSFTVKMAKFSDLIATVMIRIRPKGKSPSGEVSDLAILSCVSDFCKCAESTRIEITLSPLTISFFQIYPLKNMQHKSGLWYTFRTNF